MRLTDSESLPKLKHQVHSWHNYFAFTERVRRKNNNENLKQTETTITATIYTYE